MGIINFRSLRLLHGKLHDRWLAYKRWRELRRFVESSIESSRLQEKRAQEKEPDYPIDIVVTWVDGNDPAWRAEKAKYSVEADDINDDASRYRDWDTFRYWFRAVEKYAPWVNKVYLVTWGHVPKWLNLKCSKLCVVRHEDFIPEDYLPTFNSHTIEWNLWRIPGLSEHFIYFNDDMFITRAVKKTDFFSGELPRYCAIALPLRAIAPMNAHRHARLNGYGIFNSNYNITQCIDEHPEKWFNYQYGSDVKYNVRAYEDGFVSGLFFSHLGVPFRKSTFQEFCERFSDEVGATCRRKFRTPHDIMHQAVQMMEMYRGTFAPVGRWYYGVPFYHIDIDVDKEIDAILKRKYRIICMNDHEGLVPDEFSAVQRRIIAALDEVLPEKSGFEL